MVKTKHIPEKLTPSSLLVDYSPKSLVEWVLSPLVSGFASLRRGVENLLLEIEFVTPYFFSSLGRVARLVSARLIKPVVKLRGSPWLIPFIFASLWLFY